MSEPGSRKEAAPALHPAHAEPEAQSAEPRKAAEDAIWEGIQAQQNLLDK